MTTGEKIKWMREERGLTQKQLGSRIGRADSAIGRWERGDKAPEMSILQEIANALSCTMSDLLPNANVADEASNPSLGQNIRQARKEKGLSQSAFALACGVSLMTVRRWEADERDPRYNDMLNIKRVLGADFQKQEMRICPISNAPCMEARCAWWNDEYAACAVVLKGV